MGGIGEHHVSGFLGMMVGGSGITLLDTQTITRGYSLTGTDPYFEHVGFAVSPVTPAYGSITDGTSNIYAGATIQGVYFTQSSTTAEGYYTRQIIFRVNGEVANSGWTTILIGGTELTRASAAYTAISGFTRWVWTVAIGNPFVSEGDPFTATTVVKWY